MKKRDPGEGPKARTGGLMLKRIGVGLVALSFLLYGGALLVPLLPLSAGAKIATASSLAVAGEISFWAGGLILGREIVARYKKYLNPLGWFRRR